MTRCSYCFGVLRGTVCQLTPGVCRQSHFDAAELGPAFGPSEEPYPARAVCFADTDSSHSRGKGSPARRRDGGAGRPGGGGRDTSVPSTSRLQRFRGQDLNPKQMTEMSILATGPIGLRVSPISFRG